MNTIKELNLMKTCVHEKDLMKRITIPTQVLDGHRHQEECLIKEIDIPVKGRMKTVHPITRTITGKAASTIDEEILKIQGEEAMIAANKVTEILWKGKLHLK